MKNNYLSILVTAPRKSIEAAALLQIDRVFQHPTADTFVSPVASRKRAGWQPDNCHPVLLVFGMVVACTVGFLSDHTNHSVGKARTAKPKKLLQKNSQPKDYFVVFILNGVRREK